jgi:chromate reductase, NAD(P)H dehydrogenase (quinone)
MTPKILVFPGSIRSGSFNGRLADVAASTLSRFGADVTRISLADYPMPILDEDLQKREGIPENVMKLARMIEAQHGLFLACPEYNSSITPLMKNTIDWVSRVSRDGERPLKAWKGKTIALGSASNGHFAGVRGLYHVRSVLMNVGAQIITEQCSVASAATGFSEDGTIADERVAAMLETACRSLVDHCRFSARG